VAPAARVVEAGPAPAGGGVASALRLLPGGAGEEETDEGGQFLGLDVALLDAYRRGHCGGFPCLRVGRSACLVRSILSDRISVERVSRGSTTSSIRPRSAA
jgi:hypothetical protein